MIDKKKDLLLYIILAVSVVVIITTYVFIYLSLTNNNYLYFAKRNISVNLGDSYNISELGLNTNIVYDKLTITYNGKEISEEKITFDKADDVNIVVRASKLKATLKVNVVFANINEYFNIYANVGVDKVELAGDSVIELYLPNGDRELAINDGYINSFEIGVECRQKEDNFSIICGNSLTLSNGVVYANKLGSSKVYLNFETYGKSFEFDVVVKEIPIVDITSNYRFDTIYVNYGEKFDLDINTLPTYATNKSVNFDIEGSCIIYDGTSFIANEIGESFVSLTGGLANLVIKVVVCEVPDNMLVSVINDFSYGNTGKATVNFYKNDVLIDSDYYLECYQNGNLIDNGICFDNFEIKHNTFSLNILIEEKFIIRVISCKNSSLSFDISVNN